ncbi:MAG: energy transducer TonB [Burkholderiales bacterium]|nr:energy transducer TonB [Burkholderiales bacterium]
MAKARPVPRETVASPAMPSTAIPVETTPVQDAGNESDGKASDDASEDVTRGETTTANSANPVSPASAAAAQPPATVIAATRPTPSPAAAAGPVVPPHFEVAYLDNPKPAYPLAARRLKLEGTVVLRVLVKASGAPETIALGQSSGAAILDEAALAAVKSWRFVPAHQGERAIDHWVDVPIRFRLVEAGR